ncbi:MAG: RluA family pseudouridine synthase [Clostridiales Family XIII bacterium]|jgi:23S rRNA pseudouridine955/2504/2580 synthase|nr:RluA family pseudouridine synthase [Clostridiales Family XIII bacterium]
MVKIVITENEAGQRLDRFLKKYLRNAPLSYIYKAIRKDVKVNGRRVGIDAPVAVGDEIAIYISDGEAAAFRARRTGHKAKRQFGIAYEDDSILIAEKPLGLLTHGDSAEKKNTLANQVAGYLAERGEYRPGDGATFSPSPVNRLDRNTTGLVVFGKSYAALQDLNLMIRERRFIRKFYLTIVKGEMRGDLLLKDLMRKDRESNMVEIVGGGQRPGDAGEDARMMETAARVMESAGGYSLVEIELITGRTHQIRAQMAEAGFPVIGDPKYGDRRENAGIAASYGLCTQFLHAHRLVFGDCEGRLAYLKGLEVVAPLPDGMERIRAAMFGGRQGRSREGRAGREANKGGAGLCGRSGR